MGKSSSSSSSRGMMVWGWCISRTTLSLSRRRPSYSPCPSWSRIHCAISSTFEMMAPAPPRLSKLRQAMGVTSSSILPWGVATSGREGRSRTVVVVSSIPSGVKMRASRKSSHVVSVTASTISPAVRNMTFW